MNNSWNERLLCHQNWKFHTEVCSFLCPMYQYAINLSAIDFYDNKPPMTFTYAFIYFFIYAVSLVASNSYIISAFPHLAPELINSLSSLCASFSIGLYAGSSRTYIRQKYNIDGTPMCDILIHTFASPCALCQEAYEIEHRNSTNNYYEVPITQVMKY